jgi:hypothetical protein
MNHHFDFAWSKGSDKQVDTTYIAVEMNSALNVALARDWVIEFRIIESRLYLENQAARLLLLRMSVPWRGRQVREGK